MKKLKFVSLFVFMTFFLFNNRVFSASKQDRSSSARSSSSRSVTKKQNTTRSASTRLRSASAASAVSGGSSTGGFEGCMDSICKSSDDSDEKGRCRCSSQLSRIEKVLRDIEDIQNEADAKNKELEALMNVSNTSAISDSIDSVYNNINSIEEKAKTLASQKVDTKTLAMEGYPLYKEALEKCKGYLSGDDADQIEKNYNTLIEEDCSAYSTILKEKADTATNLLVQAQKNYEMFQEQEYKKLNQLDVNSCYTEYETCMKTQCGEEFTSCLENAKLEAALKKCQSINYGKCESNKSTVLVNLRKNINKALEKEKIAQACRAAMGHIINGKCLFKVLYVADNCSIAKKCGDSQEKEFNPGYTVTCDDKRGDFKELIAGCKESCYLIGPNGEEKKIGQNAYTDTARNVVAGIFTLGITAATGVCKTTGDLDRYTLPVPEGWGRDGYPLDEELKKAF